MPGFFLPALMAGTVIIAAIDIYRSREKEKPKRKRIPAPAQNPPGESPT